MYQRNPIIDQILNIHKVQAEGIVRSTSSKLVKKAFTSSWSNLNNGSFQASISGQTIMFNPSDMEGMINKWIHDFEICLEAEEAKFKRIEDPTFSDKMDIIHLKTDIEQYVLYEYRDLKRKIGIIDTKFANAARAYRSPLHQALNDINQLYNDMNNIDGDFTGFENVSVYVHGIEDTGKKFFESAVEAAEDGDVIAYEDRHGNIEYYVVSVDKGIKDVNEEPLTFERLKQTDQYNDKNGRLHIVYETEYKNEHRQKTSDDLTEKLIEMGLLNDETKIDLFAHSYGGRRSLQFAMDYPDHVRSITTIGTPYDKNILSRTANTFPGIAKDFFNKNPTEYSNYLDFNSKNQRTDDGILHSNVYTDMKSEAMLEDIEHLKVANPEAYQKLEEMEITAAAGRDTTTYKSYNEFKGEVEEFVVPDTHDGAVSVKSQYGESLGELIDNRPSYDVKGEGISNPAHSHEITDEGFIHLIRQVNSDHKE
ncbi:alpha/beta fold hydrolase [Pseudogracilibacillus auburnensis]|uniref:Alpha/beta hydrolase family protein n=1 Tax=Pseudogracilibacillus auburnensis TaxID=1494959 RepID=A0A2V3VWQ1_9BACI|nr:alpha/beta fold hydrolase [Pseudogracilibacillus auburnensis]MBO1001780.1 alpha/beta fold hydrolase [Pseudogracilibacillus auburnensis]PXW86010.1 alpha/beta hydrolase family protein [Pseudogracilibacillus auburnensis]